MSITYAHYLKLDALLHLQQPRSEAPEHDEMLFIVIHQVYELWFKQLLHEFDHLMALLNAGETPSVLHTFKRVLTILKTLVAQVDILETMTPLDFLSFRDRLESSSGFQSAQFREMEFVLGYKRREATERYFDQPAVRARLETRLQSPSLWQTFLNYLAARGVPVPPADLNRDATLATTASAGVQTVLVPVYRQRPDLAQVCERLVDLDEGLQEWRYRHVKMVERTIGAKPGTGGSLGSAYLKGTLFQPLFPDLWAIRSEL